ncbi:hypothetical protein HZB60_10820 [candidate division KSB1 bacterium]|nr:hypothetical protein [candidate division KSB1 bacterium]
MKKLVALLLIVSLSFAFVGCYTFEHQVGKGAQTGMKVEKKQWFILWGLVPLSAVDSQAMAKGAADYTIKTEMSPVDVVVSIVTSWLTVYPQTVTVTK